MNVDFLNIRHLRAFREVVATHSISEAAERMHLSQPAVTQAISKLEERLQTQLFSRRSNGLFPTEACSIFAKRVDRLLDYLATGAEQAIRLCGSNQKEGFANFQNLITAAHLKALVAIAETGNFSQAARTVGLSQPSIHRAARDLEKLAGFSFFVTDSKGVNLTQAAEKFLLQTKLAFAELCQGLDELELYRGKDTSKIHVGSMPLARTSILPRSIHALLQEVGNAQILTVDGPYPELLRRLRYADLDVLIGALRDPSPGDDVIQEPLFEDPLSIIVGADHPLVKVEKPKLKDTLNYPWIAPPKETPAGKYLAEVLKIPDLPNTPVRTVSSSLVLIRGLLKTGDYVTIMSKHQISQEIDQGAAVVLDIKLNSSNRTIGLTYRSDWQPTKTQMLFLDFVRQESQAGRSP